jgi:type VI secretion system secreted protein VgrG
MKAFIDDVRAVYEHQLSREQAPVQPLPARFALEAANASTRVGEGRTSCRRLLPGHRFRLREHDLGVADGSYVAVACQHQGRIAAAAGDDASYVNRFTAVPGTVPFRPPRPQRFVRQTLETAVVVGPPGEEIHTDVHGRVRVQFPWDLDGDNTDAASCWLRVAQAWSGASFGTQFLPRVGTEVLVGYIDGDVDRPVVVGTVHNAATVTPFSFPEDFETSGIRTRSSPNGAAGHELIFRDRTGAESAALRSSGALDVSAARNASFTASGAMFIASGGDRTEETGGDLTTSVTGEQLGSVGGDRLLRVAGADALEVGGEHQSSFHKSRVIQTDGAVIERIGSSRVTTIG